MVDYTALPKKTQTRLERIHSSVTGVVPEEKKSWKFNTKDLVVGGMPPAMIDEVKDWSEKGCLYLYTFQIATEGVNVSELLRKYSKAKDDKIGGRAYARPHKDTSA